MNKKWELLGKIKPLVNKWYAIHSIYITDTEYWYELIWNSTISITLRSSYYDNRSGKIKQISTKALNRTFRNIIRDTNAETIKPPITRELGYEDSLRLLFLHYPYSETNWSNCILVSNRKDIVAIQYNWRSRTNHIYTELNNLPNFIVINNKKKVEGRYEVTDYPEIEERLKTLSLS